MCGIAGWVDFRQDLSTAGNTLAAMTDCLVHRGPDSSGLWMSRNACLGHRRLAVIDLPGGSQPMLTTDSAGDVRYAISFSGEIYNYRELGAELMALGHCFDTRSDTEVVLKAYAQWGLKAFERCNGMFALAIWDVRRMMLVLARDRMGIKPLYYHSYPGGLIFGSEPKALMANPAFKPRLELSDLPTLLNPRLLIDGETPLANLEQVRPGHIVTVTDAGRHEQAFWKLRAYQHELSFDQTTAHCRQLLETTVGEQLHAEVPVGTLLSGGLDSSALTALAARSDTPRSLTAFSIEFLGDETDFTPSPLRPELDNHYAVLAAAHLRVDHRRIVVDPNAFEDVYDEALTARDLPSLGQFDVSMLEFFRAIRKEATVVLSGEGADEIFGGYPWFFNDSVVGRPTFPWLGEGARLTDLLAPGIRTEVRPKEQEAERYNALLASMPPSPPGESAVDRRMRQVLFLSLQGPLQYLLDRKDRMSMAVGLEARVPFLDHRLVEFGWNIPWQTKVAHGREKDILRSAVADLLPGKILYRAKSGYPATFSPEYTRATLRSVHNILRDPQSSLGFLFDTERVAQLLDQEGASLAYASTAQLVTPIVEVERWMRRYDISFS
ncbi:MAG: hypothetical protein QOH03_1562 [Kribbellaceae bacterium]|jgi:asparagine synthase (glutamine-hydrolysing)|nr:hypothetical protein [Kribbellaceae bacterium]